jgi:hypothetical protein
VNDDSFYFEPELPSGVFARAPRTRLEHLAERVRALVGSEVGAVLDLTSDQAELGVHGALLECSGDKETVLMAWLQELDAFTVRYTPPKLALVFGCLEILVVPMHTPARLVGVLAVSLPTQARRAVSKLGALAAELALELEIAERRACRVTVRSSDALTEPSPPNPELEQVA